MFHVEQVLTDLETGRLITRMEDKPKRSLVGACHKLQRDFTEYLTRGWPDPELVFFYNFGSLLQYHCGEFDRGEELCRYIITVCQRLAARNKSNEWLGAMIQPFINRARIVAARGNLTESLDILQRVKLFADKKQNLQIGNHTVSTEIVDELSVGKENIILVGRNVYLSDSVRAFLFAHDYAGLLQFLNSLENDPFYVEDHRNLGTFLEAKARAYLGMEKYGDALAVLRDFSRFMKADRGRLYPAMYTLSAEVYWRCGQVGEASKVLSFAQKLIERALDSPTTPRNIVLAYHLYLIAVAQFRIQDLQEALRNARVAWQIAADLGDETLVMKNLILLCEIIRQDSQTRDQEAGFRDALVSQAQTTFYRLEKALSYIFLSQYSGSQRKTGDTLDESLQHLRSRGLTILRTIRTAYAARLFEELAEVQVAVGSTGSILTDGCRPQECVSDAIDQIYQSLLCYSPLVLPDFHRVAKGLQPDAPAPV